MDQKISKYREAFQVLLQAGYSVTTATDGYKTIGLEVYSSALSMDLREKLIKELLPNFTVYGLKNNEKIYIE
jgi:hypothetical protein